MRELIFEWSFEPWVIVCLSLSAAAYAAGVARLWRRAGRGRGLRWRQVGCFALGWIALGTALISPLDALGERLFSAHMVQHEMLMLVAAPLFVVARPLAAWVWMLPVAWRSHVGALFRPHGWRSFWRALTSPLSAWGLHALALWGWHLPAAFDGALASEGWHALQHVSFFATALLFWWSVLGQEARHAPGPALSSLFTTMMHTGALGALMTLSSRPWYAPYVATSTALGVNPLDDQQLGGLVMWIPASTVYLVSGLWVMAACMREPRRTLGLAAPDGASVHRLPAATASSSLDAS